MTEQDTQVQSCEFIHRRRLFQRKNGGYDCVNPPYKRDLSLQQSTWNGYFNRMLKPLPSKVSATKTGSAGALSDSLKP